MSKPTLIAVGHAVALAAGVLLGSGLDAPAECPPCPVTAPAEVPPPVIPVEG